MPGEVVEDNPHRFGALGGGSTASWIRRWTARTNDLERRTEEGRYTSAQQNDPLPKGVQMHLQAQMLSSPRVAPAVSRNGHSSRMVQLRRAGDGVAGMGHQYRLAARRRGHRQPAYMSHGV